MLAQSSKAYFVLHNGAQKHFLLLLRDILVSPKHRRQALPPPPTTFKTCSFITEGTTSYTFFLYQRTKTYTTSHHLLFFLSRLYDTVQQMQL